MYFLIFVFMEVQFSMKKDLGMQRRTIAMVKLVEAAGIEPASVNPPHTGDYMFSLSTV